MNKLPLLASALLALVAALPAAAHHSHRSHGHGCNRGPVVVKKVVVKKRPVHRCAPVRSYRHGYRPYWRPYRPHPYRGRYCR